MLHRKLTVPMLMFYRVHSHLQFLTGVTLPAKTSFLSLWPMRMLTVAEKSLVREDSTKRDLRLSQQLYKLTWPRGSLVPKATRGRQVCNRNKLITSCQLKLSLCTCANNTTVLFYLQGPAENKEDPTKTAQKVNNLDPRRGMNKFEVSLWIC